MFDPILVPLDGSELSEKALPAALELRSKLGAKLIFVRAIESLSQHMIQTPVVLETAGAAAANVELLEEVVEAERDEATKYLQSMLQKAGEGAEALVLEGEASDAISDVAEQRKVGLIVMSSHGRGGLGRLIFGSTADAILKHAKSPVLLIRAVED